MEFMPETLENVRARMAQIKAHAHGSFSTNYFRQEMVGPQILVVATDQTILLANDEFDFFRLYFFASNLGDLGQLLQDARYPGEVVIGYLTKKPDKNVATAFKRGGFLPIATYGRMETYRLPRQRPNPALEYAVPADADQLHQDLFRAFNKYTDHLPSKIRLLDYITNRQIIVNRHVGQIVGAVCFQLKGLKVNYNYIYSFSGDGLDFLRLQNNFYGVMNERGIRAGFLWINRANNRLVGLYQATGWRFDGLEDYFYLRALQP